MFKNGQMYIPVPVHTENPGGASTKPWHQEPALKQNVNAWVKGPNHVI